LGWRLMAPGFPDVLVACFLLGCGMGAVTAYLEPWLPDPRSAGYRARHLDCAAPTADPRVRTCLLWHLPW
jgi:hypothetical protein